MSLKRDARSQLIKSLAESLILHEKITTTEVRAKEIRPVVERLITRARTGSVANRRVIRKFLTAETAKHLVDVVAPRYMERNGGYTRITKREPRKGDSALRAIIEFV